MAKTFVLYTEVIEGDTDAHKLEKAINRQLSSVMDKVLSVQVEELQKDREYRLFVTIE